MTKQDTARLADIAWLALLRRKLDHSEAIKAIAEEEEFAPLRKLPREIIYRLLDPNSG